jgi:peptide/nickel transport system substrate-binding protein
MDSASRDIIGLMTSDLIHINRDTQRTEPAIAKSWTVSPDGRRYTLYLRQGLRFSDGSPFNADDIVFSWNCYLDLEVNSPQRDLLTISGEPIKVRKVDQYTVEFTLPHAYAAAERLFDSVAVLPRHLLQQSFNDKKLSTAWGLNTSPDQIAGLGPFRLKRYVPGQRIVLERNPYYWKRDLKGQSLPYLSAIVSIFVANADAEALRFDAGDTDVISRLNPADFALLKADEQTRRFRLHDLGPGLEYDFLFFNENPQRNADRQGGASSTDRGTSDSLAEKQPWFRQLEFRQAISNAINRSDLVHLAYRDQARPISVPVTDGNKLWINHEIAPSAYSLSKARELARRAGFSSGPDGSLVDSQGHLVSFSILVNGGNPQQVQMATLIQRDLEELGVGVTLDEVDFHTFLNRIFTTYKYEAAIMALADGDADPNSELNVLSSNGSAHVWDLKPGDAIPAWQRTIDRLMQDQLIVTDYRQRKGIYDQVQQIVRDNMPVIYLISPDILVGAKDCIGNFHPAILGNYTLWNVDQLFIRQ